MWEIIKFDTIDSTNNALKQMTDASHGTVLTASHQTAGRGRMGRSFSSPHGIYLSALLIRKEEPSQLMHLTAMTAVAVRRAILESCGIDTQIKWVNDLLLDDRKLCGILVEGNAERYVIGIGINANTDANDLPEDVRRMAAVLTCDEDKLLASIVRYLRYMDENLLTCQSEWMREYAANCITVGKTVQVITPNGRTEATALDVDDTGALLVRYPDGREQAVLSGEVSVRGLYGYV